MSSRVARTSGPLIFAIGVMGFWAEVASAQTQDMWVMADRLTRRTCPATDCGDVGWLLSGQKVGVYEERDGWARITEPYDASCREGSSDFVDEGNAVCEVANGIVDGQMAEWVSMQYLSSQEPADPSATATADERLIARSDDFATYRSEFLEAAKALIEAGTCSEADFLEMGGWVASTSQGPTTYFTYCGGMTVANRIYLNAATGETYR